MPLENVRVSALKKQQREQDQVPERIVFSVNKNLDVEEAQIKETPEWG